MRAMLDRVGEAPCFLECTNPQNVAFYEKFGFKLIETGTLKDEQDQAHQVDLYYMMRGGRYL